MTRWSVAYQPGRSTATPCERILARKFARLIPSIFAARTLFPLVYVSTRVRRSRSTRAIASAWRSWVPSLKRCSRNCSHPGMPCGEVDRPA